MAPVRAVSVLSKPMGRAPWAVEVPRVRVTFRNRALTRVTVLDMNGMRTAELPLTDSGFDFPAGAMYAVVE